MSHIIKDFPGPFILEKSKLDRLITVIRECVGSSPDLRESIEVRHKDGAIVQVELPEKVYNLHNSGRKEITKIQFTFSIDSKDSHDSTREVHASFSGDHGKGRITIIVSDNDSRWVSETFSRVEEQIERCLKKDFMNQLAASHLTSQLALPLLSLILLVFTTVFMVEETDLRNHMWLTNADMKEISSELETSTTLSQEQYLTIVTRQLKNIILQRNAAQYKSTWPAVFVVIPILLAIGVFIYLITKCYPSAVFLWGDREEWYKTLEKRRNVLWNTVLGGFMVGILAGLFLSGLEKYFK